MSCVSIPYRLRRDDVAQVVALIAGRVARLLERRGVARSAEGSEAPDLWSEEAPVLAAVAAGSVEGRVALGRRAGARVRRCGDPPEEVAPTTPGPCHASAGGFDLQPGLMTRAGQRDRLERLCRYALRPPLAQERLHRTSDGEIWLTLPHRWGRRDDPPALRPAGAAGAASSVNTEAAGEPDSVLRHLGPTRGVARRACSGYVTRCGGLGRGGIAKGRGRRGHEWRQVIPCGCVSVGRVDAPNVRTRCRGVSPLRRAAAARRADRAGVGGATHLATPRSTHRGPRGAASAGATPATRNRGSVPGRSRIRRRLLRALRRAKRGVGVRRRFSSRSAFSLALLRLLDESRLQTAALSALSKAEGLSKDRERALCERET